MKVDFIHIGYHKTATTWLQLCGFREHPDIVMLNDSRTSLDSYFVNNFVHVDENYFNADVFEKEFTGEIKRIQGDVSGLIVGICEENISGHYWHGRDERMLIERVARVFGDTKIIITIRNQLDMLISLYANYVKFNAGTRSLGALLLDKSVFGEKVFEKLCYDRLVCRCLSLFGKSNVMVVCYEDFASKQNVVFNNMLTFAGAPPIDLPPKITNRRVNPSYSVPSEAS